jgi:SAGA-associated factor 73
MHETTTEAAIDANAPLEDDDEAHAGFVDSEDETNKVMPAFKRFGINPLVQQPVLEPIQVKYDRERLQHELNVATDYGKKNIFKVVSKNGVPLEELGIGPGPENGFVYGIPQGIAALYHPHPHTGIIAGSEDAPGEPDTVMGGMGSRNGSAAFGLQQPPMGGQRRASTASRASSVGNRQ